jgi:hypothetical protein
VSTAETAAPGGGANHGSGVLPCCKWLALEALVLDPGGNPVARTVVELRRADGQTVQSRTDRAGMARVEGLDAGEYGLTLPGLAGIAWKLESHAELPSDRRATPGPAAWSAPAEQADESIRHTVVQGETLTRIAHRYGFPPAALWEAEENRELAQQRASMDVLAPGDVVVVPAKGARRETASGCASWTPTTRRARESPTWCRWRHSPAAPSRTARA